MTALEEALAAKEIFRQELESCQRNLSAARASRDDALGRAVLAERRAVEAESSEKSAMNVLNLVREDAVYQAEQVDRLKVHRLILAHHVRILLQRERQQDEGFHHVYRALSLPPILWPFIGMGRSLRRTWRRVLQSMRKLRRKAVPC